MLTNETLAVAQESQLKDLKARITAELENRNFRFKLKDEVEIDYQSSKVTIVRMHQDLVDSHKGYVFFLDNGRVFADTPESLAKRVLPKRSPEAFEDVISGFVY